MSGMPAKELLHTPARLCLYFQKGNIGSQDLKNRADIHMLTLNQQHYQRQHLDWLLPVTYHMHFSKDKVRSMAL